MRNVFISYYHKDDQDYKDQLVRIGKNRLFFDQSVEIGDIDDSDMSDEEIFRQIRDGYICKTDVTIVLLGLNTKGRKHVDREVGSSLRDTKNNSRCGLLIIVLPEFFKKYQKNITQENAGQRIADNVREGYAEVISWDEVQHNLTTAIENAFRNKKTKNPNNRASYRRRNS